MTTPLPQVGTIITFAEAQTLAGTFGKTVTEENVALAELLISMRTGTDISTTDAVDAMDPTDRYWIAQAIVFQAIWLPSQPDIMERMDASQVSTDGDSMVLNHDSLILAPMAKWAILRTSLMTWGTAIVEPDERILGTNRSARDITNIGFRPW